jgi:hypothetical protein
MASTKQIRTILESKVEQATAKLKPLEENTRRLLGETAQKIKTTSSDRIKSFEGTIKDRIQIPLVLKRLEGRLPKNLDLGAIKGNELFEKGSKLFLTVFQILNQNNVEQISALQEEVEKLNKKVTSLERRLTSRVQRKDIKPLITRLEKIEKKL